MHSLVETVLHVTAQSNLLFEGTRNTVHIDFNGVESTWVVKMRLRNDYSVLTNVTDRHALQPIVVKNNVLIQVLLSLNCLVDVLYEFLIDLVASLD